MKRSFALLLSIILLIFSCGCKTDNGENVSESFSEINTYESENIISDSLSITSESEPSIIEPVYINDYYNYALKDWLDDLSIDPYRMCAIYDDETDKKVEENLLSLIYDKSIDEYPDNIGMQKLLLFYKQLNDETLFDKNVEHILDMVAYIESVDSIEEYLALVTNTDYMGFDNIFRRDYVYTDEGDYILQFKIYPYDSRLDINDDEKEFLNNELIK